MKAKKTKSYVMQIDATEAMETICKLSVRVAFLMNRINALEKRISINEKKLKIKKPTT